MTTTVYVPSNTTDYSLVLGDADYTVFNGSNNVDATIIVGNGSDTYYSSGSYNTDNLRQWQ